MDPISLKLLTGAAGAGGGAPDIWGFEVTDSGSTSTYAKAQADSAGNVYGAFNNSIFKVDPTGTLVWQKQAPSVFGYSSNIGYINSIAVSPNGAYLAVGGRGGPANGWGTGQYAVINKIFPNNGNSNFQLGWYNSSTTTTNRMGMIQDLVVLDNGTCHGCGYFRDMSGPPYHDFLRASVDFTTNSQFTATGYTNRTYPDYWNCIDANPTYVACVGDDQNAPQNGYTQANMSLMNANNNLQAYSYSWQSNSGNGATVYGVAIKSNHDIVCGFFDGPTQKKGYMLIPGTGSTISYFKDVYLTSIGDMTVDDVATDDVNLFLVGRVNSGNDVYVMSVNLATHAVNWATTITEASGLTYYRPTTLTWRAGLSGTDHLDLMIRPQSKTGNPNAFFRMPSDTGPGAGTIDTYTFTPFTPTVATSTASWYNANVSVQSTYGVNSPSNADTAGTGVAVTALQ